MNILDICDFLLKSTLTIIRHKRRVGLGEMEKTIKNTTSMNVVLVDVTPEALREIANRMEMAARAAMPHEYTMVPLTGGITLCYKPEISRMNFIKISDRDSEFKEMLAKAEQEANRAIGIPAEMLDAGHQ